VPPAVSRFLMERCGFGDQRRFASGVCVASAGGGPATPWWKNPAWVAPLAAALIGAIAAVVVALLQTNGKGGAPPSTGSASRGDSSHAGPTSTSSPVSSQPPTSTPPSAPPTTTTPSGLVLGTPLAGSAPTHDGTVHYQGSDVTGDAGGITINGGRKTTSAYEARCFVACGTPRTEEVDANIGRSYSFLCGRFGVDDLSTPGTGNQVEIKVVTESGRVLYDGFFKQGEGGLRTFPVSGVLTLRFLFIGTFFDTYPAVGDPTVYPAGASSCH
jgi:hypothetical protein